MLNAEKNNTISISLLKGFPCDLCEKVFFTIRTEEGYGVMYYTCPICNRQSDSEIENDLGDYHYCETCKIIFDICCTHAVNGCTCDIYYARLFGEIINGNIIMPISDSIDDVVLDEEKYKWICMCKGTCDIDQCKKAFYKNYPNVKCRCELNLSAFQ